MRISVVLLFCVALPSTASPGMARVAARKSAMLDTFPFPIIGRVVFPGDEGGPLEATRRPVVWRWWRVGEGQVGICSRIGLMVEMVAWHSTLHDECVGSSFAMPWMIKCHPIGYRRRTAIGPQGGRSESLPSSVILPACFVEDHSKGHPAHVSFKC